MIVAPEESARDATGEDTRKTTPRRWSGRLGRFAVSALGTLAVWAFDFLEHLWNTLLGREHRPKRAVRSDEVRLAEEVLGPAWAHPLGQGRSGCGHLLRAVVEKIHMWSVYRLCGMNFGGRVFSSVRAGGREG